MSSDSQGLMPFAGPKTNQQAQQQPQPQNQYSHPQIGVGANQQEQQQQQPPPQIQQQLAVPFQFGADNSHTPFNWQHNFQPTRSQGRYTAEQRANYARAGNPRMLTDNQAQGDVQNRSMVLVDKKRKRLSNSILIQKADPSLRQDSVWLGDFTHPRGVVTMSHRFQDAYPDEVSTFAIMGTRSYLDEALDTPGVSVPLLPNAANSTLSIKRRKLIGTPDPCANCDHAGHTLGDCIWPMNRIWGDIYGCPNCNTKEHRFDDCPKTAAMSDEEKCEVLIVRRSGKCMIRSDVPIYALAVKLINSGHLSKTNLIMPWSRQGALHQRDDPAIKTALASWDYGKKLTGAVSRDPAVAIETLEAYSKVDPGDYNTFKTKYLIARGKIPAAEALSGPTNQVGLDSPAPADEAENRSDTVMKDQAQASSSSKAKSSEGPLNEATGRGNEANYIHILIPRDQCVFLSFSDRRPPGTAT
ncbi:hypothetical protein GGS26DRAFT_596522 [Hypomontagnella submonticulosa]|nr:hypothetical protein GGS26DRAFT_596522 [Hypomontagnella submonticulosa]